MWVQSSLTHRLAKRDYRARYHWKLVPDLNYLAMAESVEKVLKNDSYAGKIGANVRERALKMMEPQNINDQVIKAYENLFFPINARS